MDKKRIISKIENELKESADITIALAETCTETLVDMAHTIADSIKSGGKLLICGNGGSAADAQHFAAEMIGRLNRDRVSIPAIAFTTNTSVLTAVGNDYGFENIFLRQVEGLGKEGDVLLGISTSGNSPNIVKAMKRARELGILTTGLLGCDGGTIAAECNQKIIVPSSKTQRIQEGHITLIHILCELIEDEVVFT